ncbi:MAG TPA: type VI secretion system lipoprotein TssJ [Gammaproteobacteria bacterium]|jgi:type VI secretion system VasD/TssJ family lipoprotein|nr:type VI secretion system lipoprotein TssJ [Gammaproteobacteria bacterium]
MKRAKQRVHAASRAGGWLSVAASLLLAACSSAPAQLTVAPDGWTYGPRLITLQLEATETLNIDSGQAHALSVGIFQLSDPGSFGGLSASPAGAEKLLDEGATADPSIVDFDRVVLQPGEKRTVYINRAANAQYVGIVAGYYQLVSLQDVALFNIPVVAKPVGWVTKGMVAVGLQTADTDGMPGALALSAGFGPDQVAHFTSDTPGSARIFAATKGGAKGGAPAGGGKSGKGGGSSGGSGSGIKLPSPPSISLPKSSSSGSGSGGGGE